MQVKAKAPFDVQLTRAGGSVITARLDYWSATPQGWQLAGSNLFQDVVLSPEVEPAPLAKGQYTAVFTCRVEESINGVYAFELAVAGKALYQDQGNVNTTPNPHDSKAYKDQFVLVVS